MSASNKRPVAGSRSPARSNTSADAARRTRMGLLGSTALIAASLAVSPAFAQTTIASPVGGGTITRTGGSSSSTDQTGSGGGVLISNVTQAAAITVNGVTINNTTGGPTIDALRIQGETGTLNSGGALLTGTNLLTTTTNGGSALYVTANGNVGVTINSSGSVFTGSYGVNIQAPSGYIDFNSVNQSQSFIGNGTHIAGLNAVSAVNASLRLGSSTITGFDTGINASNFFGSFVEMTGGSINALVTGIRTDATGGRSNIESQAAIVAPTGIHSTNTDGAIVTTSGAGTIDSTVAGTGTGIIATSSGGTNAVTVNVGAAIGGVTAFQTGVSATNTGSGAVSVTNTAAITATATAIYSSSAATSGNVLNLNADVTGGGLAAVQAVGQGYTINVGAGATITASGTNGRTLLVQSGDGVVVNNGTIRNLTTNANSAIQFAQAGNVTNSGSITTVGSAIGISANTGLTLTNSGTIAAGGAGIYSGGNGAHVTSITNLSGGSITGNGGGNGTPAIALFNQGSGANILDLREGSTTGGVNVINGSGATTVTLAGAMTGAYNGSSALGAMNFTLASTGSMQAATFGSANDTFNWQGGTLGGVINAGTGTSDTFNSALGVGVSGSISLSNLSNFDSYNHQSGNLTLTGTRATGPGWNLVPGSSLTLDGSLTATTGTGYGITMNGNGSPATVAILTGAALNGFVGVWFNTGGANNFSNAGTVAGSNTGILTNGALTATNSGTVTAGTGGAFSFGFSLSNVTNSGTLTGGSDAVTGFGVLSQYAGATVTNSAGTISGGAGGISSGSIQGATYGGLLTVTNAAGAEIGGAVAITTGGSSRLTLNNTGRILGGANGGVVANGSGSPVSITNNAGGQIVGSGGYAIFSATAATINNAGLIGGGTVDGGGVYTASGNNNAIRLEAASTVINSGTITGGSGGGIRANAALNLTNTSTGIINGLGTGLGTSHGVSVVGAATILNAGSITGTQANAAGVYTNGASTVTNAAGGVLGTTGGYGVYFNSGAGTFNNYGTVTGDLAAFAGVFGAGTLNLFAGSVTGAIETGGFNDTLAIYSGTGTTFAGLTDGGSGITLQTAGANAAATVGTVNLGSGTDTLQLRGAGDDSGANGAAGSLDLGGSTINTAEVLTKLDNGTWTLTGAAAVPGMTINAGMGGSAGLLIFSGTGLTGAINVNGATVRATTTTAFGTGTLHMIDPTIQFAATGTYANDISLEVVNGQQAIDPTWLRNISGGTITLSGRIYETGGVGGANQYVTFDGGTTILTNTGNIWGGVTAINAGTTLQGATNTISGGSIANAGALVFNQNVDGTFVGDISGAGTLQINAPSQAVTLSGVNTFSGATTITAGTLISSGGSAVGDLSAVTIASGATLQLANSETIGGLTGAGTARVLGNTLTLGGNDASTTFSGSITDQTPVAYVGSWNVAAGPNWSTNPPTYTGQEAAALLFGGAAGDYRISTAGASTSTITDTAWYNRYGGNPANFTELAVDARIDTGGAGYNNQGDSSAYVGDHTGTPTFNYAFSGGVALGGGLTKTGTGTLTLSGTNNYTGLTSITGGTLVVQNGAAISNLSTVDVLSPGAFSVANTETIASLTGTGATTIASGQTLTLASGAGTYTGNITGGSLVLASGSWTYGGVRSGGQSSGLTMNGAGTTLSVANAGSILGGQFIGVRSSGAGNTINNLGLIQNAGTGGDSTIGAGLFVLTTTGGVTTVNNGSISDTGAGSTIQGRNAGVRHEAGSTDTLVVNNYGLIVGDLYNGVENTAGGLTVNNFAGGYITATLGNGVSSASASAVTITNAGTIGRNIAGTVTVNGYGVATNGVLTLVNQANGLITGTLGGVQSNAAGSSITNQAGGTILGNYGVVTAGGTINNSGLIRGFNDAVLLNGATALTNNAGGLIVGAGNEGVFINATGSTINNAGLIVNSASGIGANYSVAVTNSGVIASGTATDAATTVAHISRNTGTAIALGAGGSVTNLAGGQILGGVGVAINNGASGTITNAGLIDGSISYGVQMTGAGTITNQSGGAIGGWLGSIQLSGAGSKTLDLLAGSTTNGQILSTATGTQTVSIAGLLNGAYNATTGAGVDNLTLASTGSMTSATLGAGADSFVYQGGAFSGLIDAGSGTDSFTSNLSGGVASVNLFNLGNFETFAHQSGTLTLTGTGAFSGGATVQGSLIVNGTLQAAATVANGATLSGGGSITGAVTVASGATLIGAQGATLTMGSLGLSSGSTLNATFSGAAGPALFAVTGDLTLDGTVNVASTGAYGFGVYGLMTYGGALTDNGLVIGTIPGGAQRVLVQTSVAGQVNIVHAPTELLFWDGGAAGQHDNGAVNGGSGIWTVAGSEWTDANGAFNGAMEPQPGFAIFQGAGGVVTVNNGGGAVSVTGMQFAADGYRIDGDAVTLANASATIRVGDGTAPSAAWTATIASALTGSGGLVKTDLGTLILAGENTYTGGTTINAGTLQIGDGAAAGSIAGSVVNNAALVFARSDNHDFANAVSGSGTVGVSGVVTLSGAITATPGVTILDGSSLTSTGVITASNAVTFANGGVFTNAGTVNGAVVKNGAATGTVTNAGVINGLVQNAGAGLLTINNQAGGSIVGAGAAAVLSTASGAVSLNNAGDISHAFSAFVSNNALDSVTNSGRIVAGSITGGVVTAGGNDAIRLNVGGSVTNQAGGLITGTHGVASYAGLLTLDNRLGATITGVDYGVRGYAAANIVNAGVIGATDYAGIALSAGGTITNSGTIGGGSQAGANQGVTIDGAVATTIVNQAGGVINNGVANFGSGLLSVDIQAGSTVNGGILNFGGGNGVLRVAGALNGTYAGSSGADTVTLVSGGVVSGILQGNAGVDSFELAGAGAGTVNIGNVLGFESRSMNGAGVWTLTGSDSSTTAWAINSGTLAVSGGSAINDAVSVTIAAPGALQLNASERIGALNGSGAVALGSSTLTVGGAGASHYAGVIGGSGGVTVTGGGVLTLSGANTYTGATTASGATLRLGASNVLADATNLTASFAGVIDMGTFSDTVATATFFTGTRLDGSGTLSAGSYTSHGAILNANLGGGTLQAVGGTTTLNGTAGASLVVVNGGALSLGASNRLADTATVTVASGYNLNLNAFNDTIGVLALNGSLNGTGALTASQYSLNGGVVNANLGAGNLDSQGLSTLNGTSGAATATVTAGTLTVGANNRLSDAALVGVSTGATLNLQSFSDTITTLNLNGTLAGTGTLTAAQYQLNAATVNANLGAGNLFNTGGVSTLNGTSAAANVAVQAGTLSLGASNRLAANATVSVASGSTLNLNAFDDTVGLALLSGTLNGTGTLTAGEYDLNGATINANLGAGNLFNTGSVSTLNGTSGSANVIVQAGTLSLGASDRLADNATVSVGAGSTLNLNAFDDTVGLALLNGVLDGTGTLTAGEYDLNGATINANLGGGNLFNTGGVSTLTGTSGAANVVVQAGTLTLGASNRLADTASVSVASGSTLNLGAFNDTVGLAVLNGALAGTGTLTAAQYQLNAATVNANLGAGALFNLGGVSTLTGTAAASQVSIDAGTLRLGASERLSDAASVWTATGATFDVNGFNERIGALFGTGDVNVGAGRLTFGGVESGFGGHLSGAGSLVHTGGLFTLMGDHTIASISNTGGELRFLGTTTGGLSASGGSLTGAGTIGGALTASNGAVLSPGLAGVQNGVGGFVAGGLTLNGGTLAIDVLGKSGGNLIDQLRINGAATLTGGLLAPTFQGSAATDFDFSTRYLFLQANNLVGTFANGGTFTAAAQEGLFWRVRYDLAPNAAVLELRELTNFDPGATGTGNQRSVGQALSGGQLAASDDWAAILSLIAGLSDAERAAAFDSISGEPLADVTASMFSANDSFLTAVRDGGLNGRDDGGEALNFVDRLSFAGGRENSADRLGDVLGAFDPSASTGRGAGGWVSAYAGDQTLEGKPGQATVESSLNGFAGGYGVRNGSMSVGAAGGVTRLEGDVAARQGHYESDLSHAAGYAAFDDGVWAADLTASFYGGDLDTRRGITVGAFNGQAIGNTHVEGQALSASVARRFQVTDNTMIAVGAIGTASNASVDGYTETGAGGLSLVASGMERDWQSLQLSARGTQDYRVNGQGYRIYAGAGVMATAGDRQATGDMRFSGAPAGFGTFTVEGAETPPLAGIVDFGLEVGAGEGVTVSAGYRGLFSERLQDNQVGVKLKVSW